MYYKISEEDLFALVQAANMLEAIKGYIPDGKVELDEAFSGMPEDEDIIESINSCFEIID